MTQKFMTGAKPFNKIIFTLFVALVAFLLVMLLGSLLAVPIFGISLGELPTVLSDFRSPDNLSILKYFQFIQTLGLFLLPALFCAWAFSERGASAYLQLTRTNSLETYAMVLVIIIISLPVINWLVAFNSNLNLPESMKSIESWMQDKEENARAITEAFVNVNTFGGLLVNLLIMAVMPAIAEEFIFRGVLQKLFVEWTKNIHAGIIIAAFLFSTLHFQFYGFIPRMLLGILFGYLMVWSGSMWLPVAAHFFNNAMAVLAFYVFDTEFVRENIDEIGTTGNTTYMLFISMILMSFLFFMLYRRLKTNGLSRY